MRYSQRIIGAAALVVAMAGITFAVEPNMFFETGKMIDQLKTSPFQDQYNLKKELELKQKLSKTDMEAKKTAMEADMKAKKEEMESRRKEMEADMKAKKNDMEMRKKDIMSSIEAQKKQMMADLEAKKQSLYNERNSLSAEERIAKKSYFEEQKQLLLKEYESRKKELQSTIEQQQKSMQTEMETYKKEMESRRKEMEQSTVSQKKDYANQQDTYKQEYERMKKEELNKKKPLERTDMNMPGYTPSSSNNACQTVYEQIRKEREANQQERKALWSKFWETYKGGYTYVFGTENRDEIRDITDDMWSQIRLIEKKFLRTLTSNNPASVDSAISAINTVATNSRDEMAGYTLEGKTEGFNKFREAFIYTLMINKKSLLSLSVTHVQQMQAAGTDCMKKVKVILTQGDVLDNVVQAQLNGFGGPVGGQPSTLPTEKPVVMPPKDSTLPNPQPTTKQPKAAELLTNCAVGQYKPYGFEPGLEVLWNETGKMGPAGYYTYLGKTIPSNNTIKRYAIQWFAGHWDEFTVGKDDDPKYPDTRRARAYFTDHNFKILECTNSRDDSTIK